MMTTPGFAPGFDAQDDFGDVTAEYSAVRDAAGLVDRSSRLRMLFAGRQPAMTLTGLVTNDVVALRPGEGQFAGALTPKGKVIADVRNDLADAAAVAVMDDPGGVLAMPVQPAMVEDQLQVGVALGDAAELFQEAAAHHADGEVGLRRFRPDPVQRTLVQQFLLLGLQQRPAQTHHPGLLSPGRDQGLVDRVLGIELAHHGEALGIFPGRFQRHLLRGRVPRERRMDQRGIDAGLVHLGQRLLGGEFLDLAMGAAGRRHGL